MNKTVFFSVIVPVYNIKAYLTTCVDSILEQTFSDFECILVDDGSTDGCAALCDAFANTDSRVRVLHQENGGLVRARKTGAAAATGQYCVYVDGDDFLSRDYLTAFYSAAIETKAQVLCCGYTDYRSDDRCETHPCNARPGLYEGVLLSSLKEKLLLSLEDSKLNLGVLPFSAWAKAFRTDVLKAYQMAVPDGIIMGEDAALCVPLMNACDTLCVLEDCGYCYRINPTSLSNTFRPSDFEKASALLDYLCGALDESYHERLLLYAFYMYRRCAYACCRSLPLFAAVQELRRADACLLTQRAIEADYPFKDGMNPLLKGLLNKKKTAALCLLIKTVDVLKGRAV